MTIPLSFRHRWGGALGAAFFLGLALLFAAVVFLRPENFLLAGWDYQSHQFFLKTFLADSFRAGELPLWIPYICAGRPFAADPQSGVFYPPHLLYAVLSVPWATTLLVILHLAAAGFFCCLLTRELGLSRFAASLSGVVFMFNGFLVTHGYRGQLDPLETIAYLPLMFFLVERAQRRGRPGCYLWLGLAGALQILAGAPQIAWLTWVGLGVYLLARRLCFWKPGGVRALARSVGGGLLALAFTAGLAAVQILPTAELVGESSRSKGSIEFSATYAFAPQKVIHLFFPNYFLDPPIEDFNNEAESSAYVGLLGMALALLGLLRYQCRLKWALLVVALVNIFIMLGQATPVFGILYHLIPGFSSFRLPSRAVLMLTLCLSVYAGMGAEAIWNRSGDTRTRKLAIVLAVSLLLAMIPMAYHLAQFARRSVFEVSALWSALALAVLVLAALLLSWLRPQRWIQAAWLAFICLDVFFVGATADRYRVFESQVFRPPASEKNVIRQMRDDPGLYRFALPKDLARENAGVLAGQSGVNGFTPLALDRYYRFVHYMTWQRVPEKRTHTPDQEVFHPDHKFPFKVLNVRYSVGRGPASGEGQLISRDDYLPRAFFVPEWEVLENDEAVLQAMRSPQFDPRQVVLFHRDPGVSLSPGGPDATAQVEITRYSPRSISLKAKVQADGFLVLSEMYYPGWRAYLDGREVPILRADYLLRAIPLRAGQYEDIECRFEPRSLTIGLITTLISTLLLVITLTVGKLRGSSPPSAGPQMSEQPSAAAGKGAERLWRVQAVVLLAAGLGLPLLLRPHYAVCWANIGHHFAKQGEYDQAAAVVRHALRIAPQSFAVHFQVGNALMMQNKPQEAAEHLRRALQAKPDSAEAHSDLGGVLVRMGHFDQGLQHFRRALELKPELYMVHYNWGSTLVGQGRFSQATEHLDLALGLAPGDPRLHYQVANLWAKHGRLPRALAVLRQALLHWPDNPEFLDALAWQLATGSQKELRDGPEAVRLAQRACRETGQTNPQMLFTLAAAWAEAGQLHRAIEVAWRARSMARDKGHTTLARRLDTMLEELTRRHRTSAPAPPSP